MQHVKGHFSFHTSEVPGGFRFTRNSLLVVKLCKMPNHFKVYMYTDFTKHLGWPRKGTEPRTSIFVSTWYLDKHKRLWEHSKAETCQKPTKYECWNLVENHEFGKFFYDKLTTYLIERDLMAAH